MGNTAAFAVHLRGVGVRWPARRLLQQDGMRLRCSDPAYLAHVREYYDVLIRAWFPLQITHGDRFS